MPSNLAGRMATLLAASLSLWLIFAADAQPPIEGPSAADPATQERAAQPAKSREQYETEFLSAMRRGDLDRAEQSLRDWTAGDSQNFVPWYNFACVLSMRGKLGEAEAALQRTVIEGFSDLRVLMTDPDLRHLRGTDTYAAIIEGWDRIVDSRVDAQLESAKKLFRGTPGKPYLFEKDTQLRLAYISAFDPEIFGLAKAELAELTRWWHELVLPTEEPWRTGTGAESAMPDQPREGETDDAKPRPGRQPPWVMVVLPSRPDYLRWAAAKYGSAGQSVGGAYSHDEKRLVAMDLGSTLRHEYWHVLHWRHMDQLGQRHPVWVMEGLCSLVEDIQPLPEGGFRALPSWRTNMAKRLGKGGSLMPWDVLFELDQKRFVGSKPLAYYAQARAIFMFLADRGKLQDWYGAYVEGFRKDPTGAAAFERTFSKPTAEVEKDFRAWLKDVPEVAEEIRPGMASLPFEIGPGTGDGIVVKSTPRGKSGRASGLRMRDVITAIDAEPVRDLNDFARVLGDRLVGEEVKVSYRRGSVHGEVVVKLIRQPE